jgi:glycosyltransferase involved in cell wall biosynthesis
MKNKKSNVVIIIPAFNEQATIQLVVKQALAEDVGVIVIDDASTDNTIAELKGLSIHLIKHKHNQGKAISLWHGFEYALKQGVENIITLDGDGQHLPKDIKLLLEKSNNFPQQIIIGERLSDKSKIPKKRYYANKIANFWISWASGYCINDSQSGFRLYPDVLFKNLKISVSKNKSFVFESEILIKAAQKGIFSQGVQIPAIYKIEARASHFKGVRDITLITLMVAKSLFSRAMYLKGLYHYFKYKCYK